MARLIRALQHTMTFKESLHIMSTDIVFRVLFPRWATRFSKKLQRVYLAYDEIDVRRFSSYDAYFTEIQIEIHV